MEQEELGALDSERGLGLSVTTHFGGLVALGIEELRYVISNVLQQEEVLVLLIVFRLSLISAVHMHVCQSSGETAKYLASYSFLSLLLSGSSPEPGWISMEEQPLQAAQEGAPHDVPGKVGHELFGYVGIEAVLDQMRIKTMKTGFEFNIMVVGEHQHSLQGFALGTP